MRVEPQFNMTAVLLKEYIWPQIGTTGEPHVNRGDRLQQVNGQRQPVSWRKDMELILPHIPEKERALPTS